MGTYAFTTIEAFRELMLPRKPSELAKLFDIAFESFYSHRNHVKNDKYENCNLWKSDLSMKAIVVQQRMLIK